MSWWPFRSPSPRDEYDDPPAAPEPLEKTETFDRGNGVLARTTKHECSPPNNAEVEIECGFRLKTDDLWTCSTCQKRFKWTWLGGTTWNWVRN